MKADGVGTGVASLVTSSRLEPITSFAVLSEHVLSNTTLRLIIIK